MKATALFNNFAKWASKATGHSATFTVAVLVIVIWAITGPLFRFSDTWQLVINTATSVLTFLMVFLIQNTQNRDTGAIQVKLDELIRALEGAHDALLDLEELDQKDIDRIRSGYKDLAAKAVKELRKGRQDTGTGDVKQKSGSGGSS